jgi:predicted amidophosphoribosyltransferase
MCFLLSFLSPALCVACGGDARWHPPLCAACNATLRRAPAGHGPWCLFAYEGAAGAVVRALKFEGRARVADAMAAQIAANAPRGLLAGTVVPVPVHRDHRRRRGVDHAAELGRALAGRTGLAFESCLERVGDPLSQVGRGRRQRVTGPAGTIRVRPGLTPPPAVLLVDDVVTTGATLAACIRVLAQAGCGEIAAVGYARTTAR